MRGILLTLLIALGIHAVAQTAAPQMDDTTKIALTAIIDAQKELRERENANIAKLRAVEQDFAKRNPGYHISESTWLPEKDLPSTKIETPKK